MKPDFTHWTLTPTIQRAFFTVTHSLFTFISNVQSTSLPIDHLIGQLVAHHLSDKFRWSAPLSPNCISLAWQRVRRESTRSDTSRQLHVRHTHPSLFPSFSYPWPLALADFLFSLTLPSLYRTCLLCMLVTCTALFPPLCATTVLSSRLLCRCHHFAKLLHFVD